MTTNRIPPSLFIFPLRKNLTLVKLILLTFFSCSALFAQTIRKDMMIDGNNFIPVSALSTQSQYRKLGSGIGKLQTPYGSCTAFLISDSLILTNQHCIASLESYDLVTFLLGYYSENQGVEYQINPVPLETDRELDYAILELYGDTSMEFNSIPLTISEPKVSDPLFIIGHPEGKPLVLTESCFLSRTKGSKIQYGCSSMPGSSGSPVFALRKNNQFVLVGLHHASTNQGVNQAIGFQHILNASRILQSLINPSKTCSCGLTNLDHSYYSIKLNYVLSDGDKVIQSFSRQFTCDTKHQ